MRLKFVVSLATFTALADAGLTIYDPNYVANGTFCVDQNARDLFAALNDLRMKGKASSYYTAFKAACDSVSANGYWTTSYGDRVNLSNRAYAASALSTFDTKTAVSTGLSWSPGLAAAGQFLFNSWTQSGARGLIDANGGTSTARAQTYGELGNSSHVEYVTYAAVEFWSIQDAVNAMLIADGDPNAVVMTNLFDYRNTVAVAFKGNADIGTDGNTFMMEFQAAKSYVEKSTTNTACTITQNFGGFLCDQVGKAKDLFNAINSVRTDPNPETNAWFGS